MKRRQFLSGAAIGTAAAATTSTLATPAIASGVRTMTIASTWPRDLPGIGMSAQRFAQSITDLSDGRIQVEYYAAGERVGALDAFDAAANGDVNASHGADYYWNGKTPALGFFAAVPFGMTHAEFQAWMQYQGGQELADKLKDQFGLKHLMVSSTGFQSGGWFNREIETVDDLQGLKMRIPGMAGDVLSKLGASPVPLPGGQIYENLVAGTIDATEWVGPYNDYFMKFYEAAKYYYIDGMHEAGTSASLSVNKAWWSELSDWERKVITFAAEAENARAYNETNALNAEYLQKLVDDHGVEVRSMSEEVYEAMAEAAIEVIDGARDHSPLAAEIVDSFRTSMKSVGGWMSKGEVSYVVKRNAALGIGEGFDA